uniref:Nucleoside-diphosphate kinase n=1 Tax=Aplanochytrium stocchinoi TaxID=215587 RepID=A0A7S3PG99_9STRA|mmetsp:Transcript_35333/g.43614  ORF Transcript_35333/g.43614 Transcript_35333/m.43614 type:complete len:417 (+) Transcript_35333:116-1366(+)|eukprot:CAMPEP_0204841094 /NCGR_PEP_ID=MMETSP1346-20131115/40582_1 /ASSEMBLY_ACC=CAM_ASM_000771 /TAXON_ID=215587 /ORGANISM="Aplanochytrium stocchinoi, Strain GSBS06" /LENGTH=416 /DNA_ID=CAMNT_0051978991 /DNA_START=44 /DNA_END=1294 /DNA_ORIENTATION=+
MFASKFLKGVSRTAVRGSSSLRQRQPFRKFSASASRQSRGQPDTTSIAVAAAGLTFMLILGRGGKANAAESATVAHGEVTDIPKDAKVDCVSLESRIVTLEKEVSFIEAVRKNRAFVFLKPHAVTPAVNELVKKGFEEQGITIVGEGTLNHDVIDKNLLIDTHYGAIASKAVKLEARELNVPAKGKAGFKDMFGKNWDDMVKAGKVYNAKEACAKLGVDGAGLDKIWSQLKKGQNLIKFGGGFYCGGIEYDGEIIYVINGFYMSMRSKYTVAPSSIKYYLVEWSPAALSWEHFRGKVLGATDPSSAEAGSLRRKIYDKWQELGLPAKPDTGDNGVHASASPFEAFAERCNWTGAKVNEDPFGKALILNGIPQNKVEELMGDAQVPYEGVKQSIFDLLEDLDSEECLIKALNICKVE